MNSAASVRSNGEDGEEGEQAEEAAEASGEVGEQVDEAAATSGDGEASEAIGEIVSSGDEVGTPKVKKKKSKRTSVVKTTYTAAVVAFAPARDPPKGGRVTACALSRNSY